MHRKNICIDKYTYIYNLHFNTNTSTNTIRYTTIPYNTIHSIPIDPPFVPIKSVLYMFYSMSCFGFSSSFTIFLEENFEGLMWDGLDIQMSLPWMGCWPLSPTAHRYPLGVGPGSQSKKQEMPDVGLLTFLP